MFYGGLKMEFLQKQKSELEARLNKLLENNNFLEYDKLLQTYLQVVRQLEK